MNIVTLKEDTLKDPGLKEIIEVRLQVLSKIVGVEHKIEWGQDAAGAVTYKVTVDEDLMPHPLIYRELTAEARRVCEEMEQMAVLLTALDTATGGMLMRKVIEDMQARGEEVPQDLVDFANNNLITATIVEDEHTVH